MITLNLSSTKDYFNMSFLTLKNKRFRTLDKMCIPQGQVKLNFQIQTEFNSEGLIWGNL